jgi:hypothetical protein
MFDKKDVFWFLGLTFGLTWLIDLVIYLRDPIWRGKGGNLPQPASWLADAALPDHSEATEQSAVLPSSGIVS